MTRPFDSALCAVPVAVLDSGGKEDRKESGESERERKRKEDGESTLE